MGILSVLTSSTFSIQADGESSTLMKVVETVRDNVWGIPLIVLIMGAGLLLTVRTGGLQFRRLGKALKYMWFNEEGGEGEVSSFGALCTALAATIGTGNIVGVATAVMAGGPGALFWMLVAAAVGMATKYSEGILAVKYRQFDKKTGKALGGPFYYIEKGMGERFAGKNWRWLGNLFAIFGAFAALMGTGTFAQISGISKAADTFFDPNKTNIAFSIGDQSYSWSTVITAIVVALFVGLVIIGGIKRIAAVTTYIVPFMAVLYITVCLIILIYNGDKVGGAIALVVKSAFGHGYSPVIAGGIGAVIAHEISHAFDTNGASFDENGSLNNWWTEHDYQAFTERTQKVIDQFEGLDSYGAKVNGKLTVSENVADLGGIAAALEAAKKEADFSAEEFFTNFARIWRMKGREEYMKLLASVDVHAPAKLRTNVQLPNFDDFFTTFDVQEGDGMWRSPEERVMIW